MGADEARGRGVHAQTQDRHEGHVTQRLVVALRVATTYVATGRAE